ncbi:MAG: F0F1 ATP synthase subunit A [Propylenella sp.]
MQADLLEPEVLFWIGPVLIAGQVVTTWAIMAFLALLSWLAMRNATVAGDGLQSVLEIVVETISAQIRETIQTDPWPYVPLVGTLFILIVTANLSTANSAAKPAALFGGRSRLISGLKNTILPRASASAARVERRRLASLIGKGGAAASGRAAHGRGGTARSLRCGGARFQSPGTRHGYAAQAVRGWRGRRRASSGRIR